MFDLQARGARGLWPRNTLVWFARAMELGVSGLELVAPFYRDSRVVVSHDPNSTPTARATPRGRFRRLRGPADLRADYARCIL